MARPHSTRERRRAAGQCLFCGGTRKPGVMFCERCLSKQANRDRGKNYKRCKVCHKDWRGKGSACPGCAAVPERMAAARGPVSARQTRQPGRAEVLEEYARRAALGMPLFE